MPFVCPIRDYIPRVNGITVMLPYDKRPDDVQVVPDEYPG
jgi:hypothetical protein